jgi:hypothetical protein
MNGGSPWSVRRFAAVLAAGAVLATGCRSQPESGWESARATPAPREEAAPAPSSQSAPISAAPQTAAVPPSAPRAEAPPPPSSDRPSAASTPARVPSSALPGPANLPPRETDPPVAIPVAGELIEIAPHVRVNKTARIVEFDGTVPIDAHNPETPIVYLEVVCCTPDTREHEALVVTKATPSLIHAALLSAGFQNGAPGLVDFRGPAVVGRAPTGDSLRVEIVRKGADGKEIVATPTDWIVREGVPDQRLAALPAGAGVWGKAGGWVFSGSRLVKRRDRASGQMREVYDADGAGVVIGLTTFGSEMIAWRQVLSPESTITAPVWIADTKAVPKAGTGVIVRLRAE